MALESVQVAHRCHQLVRAFLDTPADSYSANFTQSLLPAWSQELHQSVQRQVNASFSDLCKVVSKYGLEQLSISYNGGKDCLVLLVVYMAAIWEATHATTQPLSWTVNSVYVHSEPEFHEQMDFLDTSVSVFGLNFTTVYTYASEEDDSDNASFSSQLEGDHVMQRTFAKFHTLHSQNHTLPSGFETYLDSNPTIRAIVAGIRRTDPYAADLVLEQETDGAKGWPKFTRVNPVLEWNTAEVWTFVRWLRVVTSGNAQVPFTVPTDFTIEYCPLYDVGYTSLGGRHNTVPNPGLRREDGTYRPAYEVVDDDIERLGRNQKGKV